MKKHKPNYILLLFFFLLFPPFIYPILNIPNGEFTSILLTLIGAGIIVTSLLFIARNFKSVKFENGHISLKYIITGFRIKIEYAQISGITYDFNYDHRRKYQWKEINLTTLTGKTYSFRKSFFSDFLKLEMDLRNKFMIIKKSTESIMTPSELIDFNRENKYFDIAKAKQDIRISIILLILFVFLSGFILINEPLNINEKEIQSAFYFMLIGLFFVYRIIHNLHFLRKYKKLGDNL